MSHHNLIQIFLRATIFAGAVSLAGCGNTPPEPPKKENTTSAVGYNPEEAKVMEAIFLQKAKAKSLDIEKKAAVLLSYAFLVKDSAEAGRIGSQACALMIKPENKVQLTEMQEEYATAVQREVFFKGETEAGKDRRVAFMGKVANQIESSAKVVLDACNFKYGV